MTIKSGMAPVHPGEILREELNDLGLSARALAKAIGVPANRVTAILNGDRGITADTALRLARYFDTTAQFWLNLQQTWQIRQAEIDAASRVEQITPHQVEVIREAARTAREMQNISASAAWAFRIIEHNVALCDQLRTAERSLRVLNSNRQLLRALESPLDELQRAGVFDTSFCHELSLTQQWLANYNEQFRLPASAEISRLIAELQTTTQLWGGTTELERVIESIKSPWLNVGNELGSVQRLLGLQSIGELIAHEAGFEPAVANTLRTSLGDWRDAIAWPDEIWTDLSARAEFYADLGFDMDLTDMPAPAFREAAATTIQSEPPSLVDTYEPPQSAAQPAHEAEVLSRTREAHEWLQGLESQVRRFIDSKMNRAFGPDWPQHQLPDHKYDEWTSKQEGAGRFAGRSCPLIAYADFNDCALVVCERDNWEQVFRSFFGRPESVRESFQRLQPVRLDTIHGRPITQNDELLLRVETKRIMQCIAA